LDEARAILDDPMRDQRYLDTRLGPEIVEYLRWKRLANGSPVTLDSYERILARLAVRLPAGVGIADIGVEHLMLVLDEIPPGSWKLHRAVYNGLFKWAISRDRRSAKNPVEMLPSLRPQPRRVIRVFSEAEYDKIVRATRLMDDPARDHARAILLQDSGIRKGEARRLRVRDINAADRFITVLGKGDKEREIPVCGDFWLAWESALLEPIPKTTDPWLPDDYVWFPTRVAGEYLGRARQVTRAHPERPMSERAFHEWWQRLLDHAGVSYRKIHMTRHTFATAALDASGGDLYGVAEMLGHASTKTTEAYLHSSKRRKESVAEALARVRRAANSVDGEV
jgi:site-specific recombinase XerD